MKERITHVAIILDNGDLCAATKPNRHHNLIHEHGNPSDPDRQGFCTSTGRFVDRKTAWDIATAAGQIVDDCGCPGILFSENLW